MEPLTGGSGLRRRRAPRSPVPGETGQPLAEPPSHTGKTQRCVRGVENQHGRTERAKAAAPSPEELVGT